MLLFISAVLYLGIGAVGVFEMLDEPLAGQVLSDLVGESVPHLGLILAVVIWPATFILVGALCLAHRVD